MVTHELHYIRVCCEDKYIFFKFKVFKQIFYDNSSLKFEITAKRLYAASQRVL